VIQTATIVLPTGQLTASAVDVPGRTIEGTLVPFGEVGQPAVNGIGRRVSVRPGALLLAAQVDGIDTHDRPMREVSRLVAHEVRAEGIWGRFSVDPTPAGDVLLAQVADGKRLGLSIEADGLLLDATTNEVVGGVVRHVAHVDDPAFPSARVHAMTAALAVIPTPTTPGDSSVTEALAPAAEPTPAAVAAPALDYAQLAAALAPHLTAAVAPAGLPTGGALTAAAPTEAAAADSVERLIELQAAQYSSGGDVSIQAALADITNTALPIFQRPAGAIPKTLWSNSGYTRRFVPLLSPQPLTSMKFGGWEFTELPEMDDWAGDKTQIPTNEVDTREIEGTAARLAGGWDIDRKFRDFGDAAFWAKFYAAQTESYARKTDAKAAAAIIAAAQDVTGTATVAGYTRPAGYGTVAESADVLRAVAFGSAYLEDTPLVEQSPDYVLMNTQDWLSLLDLTNLDLPAFLSLMGVQPGAFLRRSNVPAGTVILGCKPALEWYELPGAAPIRVEALDVARGGIDSAVFGYWGTLHVRPGGIISVPLAAAG
jgi:hypothetical protein